MSDNIKATSFRVSESAVERFKELAGEMNMTQREFFDSLIGVYELESAKEKIADRGKEVEEFQGHAQRMVSIFLNALELNQNAENRIEDKYQEALQKKNSVIENIQSQLEREKGTTEYLREAKTEAEKEVETLKETNKHIEEINRNNADLVEQYKEKVDTLSTLVNEYKGYKEEIKEVRKELLEKADVIEEQRHEIRELQLKVENCEGQSEFYKSQVAELKKEIKACRKHEEDVRADAKAEVKEAYGKIRAEFDEKLLLMTEKKDLERDKALMDLKKSHDEKITELKEVFEKAAAEAEKECSEKIATLNSEHEKAVKELRKEIESLNEKA